MSIKVPKKVNCWEFKNCRRQSGGEKVAELCECIAAVMTSLPDGHDNGGTFCGRRCWRVVGTLCGGEVQGVFAQKIGNCRDCEFYLLVKEQEGDCFEE